MQKDYILEIESSESQYADFVCQIPKVERDGYMIRRHPGKEHGEGLEKYIKFTVKRNHSRSLLSFNTIAELLLGLVFTVLLFHTFLKVDPIRKLVHAIYYASGKVGREMEGTVDAERLQESFIRSVFTSLQNVGFTKSKGRLLSLIYLTAAGEVTDWLFWQVDSDIEESLLIIMQLGIQSESVVMKKSLAKLFLRYILAIMRLISSTLCHNKPVSGAMQESGNSQDRLTKLDQVLQRCERLELNREFVAMEYVKDLVINEGFSRFQVIFYLGLVTIDTSSTSNRERLKMMVVFPPPSPQKEASGDSLEKSTTISLASSLLVLQLFVAYQISAIT
ncbi:hypothetical protein FOA43_004138 [Brettanomyces nanus]|uniref:Phosphatidylinositol N-acetylglucosaminyltransferase subunit H conserved domain-containing protein n=1 Tax=Eeniella nana TaxID=13502 RepID=A0A875SDF1_EENNA|nr:uncharacterized protein FOA43_004138 [Brettanomyces nanus]QPG76744.1 hypothetical protein FOA43_004138 [Brettanomyces nanus]